MKSTYIHIHIFSSLKVNEMSEDKKQFVSKALTASRQKLDNFLSFSKFFVLFVYLSAPAVSMSICLSAC